MQDDDYRIDESGFKELTEKERRSMPANVVGWTRFVAGIPATGLFIASVALSVATFGQLAIATFELVTGHIDIHGVAIEYVECTDLFLLGVALFVLSLGIICLFITDKIPLPGWLVFHDFDDLKERLASVIVVMLAVNFLGFVLKGGAGMDLLFLGGGCALVIIALAIFVRSVFKLH